MLSNSEGQTFQETTLQAQIRITMVIMVRDLFFFKTEIIVLGNVILRLL